MTAFISRILTTVGILWISASGLCSVWLLGTLFMENPSFQDFLSTLPMVLLVGGFSVGLGFVILAIGKSIRPVK